MYIKKEWWYIDIDRERERLKEKGTSKQVLELKVTPNTSKHMRTALTASTTRIADFSQSLQLYIACIEHTLLSTPIWWANHAMHVLCERCIRCLMHQKGGWKFLRVDHWSTEVLFWKICTQRSTYKHSSLTSYQDWPYPRQTWCSGSQAYLGRIEQFSEVYLAAWAFTLNHCIITQNL